MEITFKGKVALITGAGSGMGLAAAKAFAKSGTAVALADINGASVEKAAKDLTAEGYKAIAITCDVSDETQVKAILCMKEELSAIDKTTLIVPIWMI